MADPPPPGRPIVGKALLGSAALLLLVSALFWFRVIDVAEETRPIVSGIFFLIALVEGLAGLRFLGES